MFGTKIKFFRSVILKSSKSQLKNEMTTLPIVNFRVAFLPSILCRFYSRTQSINGFPKPFTAYRKIQKLCNYKYLCSLSEKKCWKCHQPLKIKNFACELCGSLQHPKENMNFFELFSVSQTYNIDLEYLSQKFKSLQKIFHPDKFVNKPQELEISEEYSRLVNKAYGILKDPLARGFYILEIQKVPLEEASPNFGLGQDFLTIVMEKSEELDAINTEGDLKKFTNENTDEINDRITKITQAFRACNWCDARIHLLKLNYFMNIDKKIKVKQNEINSSKIK